MSIRLVILISSVATMQVLAAAATLSNRASHGRDREEFGTSHVRKASMGEDILL